MLNFNRQVVVTGLIMGGLLVVLGASIAGGQGANSGRLAVVDMQEILEEYGERNQRVRSLEGEMRTLQQEVESTATRMEQRRNQFQETQHTMTEAQRMAFRNEFEQEVSSQRYDFERKQRLLENRRESLMREVLREVEGLVARISQENNFDLVVNKRSPAVVWANPGTDITAQVRAALPAQ